MGQILGTYYALKARLEAAANINLDAFQGRGRDNGAKPNTRETLLVWVASVAGCLYQIDQWERVAIDRVFRDQWSLNKTATHYHTTHQAVGRAIKRGVREMCEPMDTAQVCLWEWGEIDGEKIRRWRGLAG